MDSSQKTGLFLSFLLALSSANALAKMGGGKPNIFTTRPDPLFPEQITIFYNLLNILRNSGLPRKARQGETGTTEAVFDTMSVFFFLFLKNIPSTFPHFSKRLFFRMKLMTGEDTYDDQGFLSDLFQCMDSTNPRMKEAAVKKKETPNFPNTFKH